MPRATKIVATLGPATTDPEVLAKLIQAGVDVVRFNFSHGTADDHMLRADRVRTAARNAGREVAIMADLQGPKIRVGKFVDGRAMLVNGSTFTLDATFEGLGDAERVGLDYKELPRDVRPRDLLLLADGLIELVVQRVDGPRVVTTVAVGGELSNNKGINRQGGGLTAPALTMKDMDDIKTAMRLGADYVAVSFPKSRTDMEMARLLANTAADEAKAPHPYMIAKIERAEAIPALQEILDASDGIMVARGDLAIEVGNAAVPALQKRMIKMARASNKLTITATQMMESMIVNTVPTRAEVSDVANAVLDGTDAVMTSAETASGPSSGRGRAGDGVDLRGGRRVRIRRHRQRLPEPDVLARRPVDRVRRAVHRVPPALQGDRRADRLGVDGAVDESARHRHSDLRADAAAAHATQALVVPQRAHVRARGDASTATRRPPRPSSCCCASRRSRPAT